MYFAHLFYNAQGMMLYMSEIVNVHLGNKK